jgi:hypothetical protein
MSGVELYYCKTCRDYHEFDEDGRRSPCKIFKPQIIDHDYMVNTIKEIAEELTRKHHVNSSRMANSNGDRK